MIAKIGKVAALAVVVISLSACGQMSKQQKGALVGGAVGATVGGLTSGTTGALLGGAGGALVGAAVTGR